MTDAISYDDLLDNRPQIFTVDKHQNGETILVTAAPALDMVPVNPGQQLNYTYSADDGCTAYSVGSDDNQAPADDDNQEPADDDTSAWPVKGKGGWFELSDGSKVRGEDNAVEAQEAIDAKK